MNQFKDRLLGVALIAALFSLVLAARCAHASVDAGVGVDASAVAAQAAPVSDAVAMMTVLSLGLGFLAALIKKITPEISFFQTKWGSLVLVLASSIVASLATGLTSLGFSKWTLIAAVFAGMTAALGSWNPSLKKKKSGGGAVALVLLAPLLASGCCAQLSASCAEQRQTYGIGRQSRKEALERYRSPTCDAACKEKMIQAIEGTDRPGAQ